MTTRSEEVCLGTPGRPVRQGPILARPLRPGSKGGHGRGGSRGSRPRHPVRNILIQGPGGRRRGLRCTDPVPPGPPGHPRKSLSTTRGRRQGQKGPGVTHTGNIHLRRTHGPLDYGPGHKRSGQPPFAVHTKKVWQEGGRQS